MTTHEIGQLLASPNLEDVELIFTVHFEINNTGENSSKWNKTQFYSINTLFATR